MVTSKKRPDTQPDLSEIVNVALQQIIDGDGVDPEALCAGDPSLMQQLQELLPTVRTLAQMSDAVSLTGSSDTPCHLTTHVLGDFRILHEVGRGGMGVVYEAEQISLGRQVAIKVLPLAALLDHRQLERFKNEARAAAMLKHPNIVGVHSVGCERGIHFYAMELVRGQSLAELVTRWKHEPVDNRVVQGEEGSRHGSNDAISASNGPPRVTRARSVKDNSGSDSRMHAKVSSDTRPTATLATRRMNDVKSFFRSVAELGVKAADALDYAHQMGVIHRDIKPSNLLLDHDGNVQITDFGLARIQTGDNNTMTGDVLGTLRYMSPEQLERGHTVDQRTDVYSLGLTLFELAAGGPAFASANRHEMTAQILREVPRFPQKVRQHLPRDLETIIGKATDKDPNCRYATAAEMSADLQRFLDQKPITARRAGWLERTRRWVGRNRAMAMSLALISCLLILLAGGSSAVAWKLSTEAERNQHALYARDMRLAQSALAHGDRLKAEKTLLAWVPEERSDDLRDFEWYYLWKDCHHPAIERTISHRLYAFEVAFLSEESEHLAIGWFNKHVNLWNWRDTTETKPIRQFREKTVGVYELLYVPERNFLVSGAQGQVTIWDLETGQRIGKSIEIVLPSENGNEVRSLSVNSDASLLAVGSGGTGEGAVRVWDMNAQEWIATMDGYPSICRAEFVSDTKLAVTTERVAKIETWNAKNWQKEAEFELDCDGVSAMAFSAARRELAVATITNSGTRTHSSVSVWDVDAWRAKENRCLHTDSIECVAYSRNGKYMATSAVDSAFTLSDLQTGLDVVVEAAHAGVVNSVAFSADGKHLASAGRDNQVHIWNVSKLLNGPLSADVSPTNDSVNGMPCSVFADNGQTVATSRYDGEVSLWNIRDGEQLFGFHVDWPDWLVQLAASPDNSLLAVTCGHFPPKPLPAKVEIWNLRERRMLKTYALPRGVFYSHSAFSPDGRYLAVCCTKHVTVIDAVEGATRCEIPLTGYVKRLEFSPDGKYLACNDSSQGTLHVIDTQDFVERREPIKVESFGCESLAFSPDSRVVAVGGFDKRVKLFHVASGEKLAEFDDCPSYIVKIDFSPNGERIVSSSADGQVVLWDADTGDRLLEFTFPHGVYVEPEFSADGQSLLVADLNDAKVFKAADREVTSKLSVTELNDIACQHTIEY